MERLLEGYAFSVPFEDIGSFLAITIALLAAVLLFEILVAILKRFLVIFKWRPL